MASLLESMIIKMTLASSLFKTLDPS